MFPSFCDLEQNLPPQGASNSWQLPIKANLLPTTTIRMIRRAQHFPLPINQILHSPPHREIVAVMAAASDTDADKQTPAQFHQFVDLPAELRIKIIQQFISTLREPRRPRSRLAGHLPFGKFAPFAVIHSDWQHEFEAQRELFGSLCLSTDDLPSFGKMLNQHRSLSLSEVGLRICIDDQVINFSGPVSAAVSRASDFIVNSMATILETVKYATSGEFQTTKAKIGLYTQIMTPYDLGYPQFSRDSSLPDGIDCDFSRLPLIHSIRKLSQRQYRYNRWYSFRHPRLLLLSPSSMLSLATRMPNLEEADVGVSSEASMGAISGKPKFTDPKCDSDMDLSRNWVYFEGKTALLMIRTGLQRDVCPRLKTLRIPNSPTEPAQYNVAMWSSCWGDKIENLEVMNIQIPSFLRNLVKLDETSEANAWPNIQVLKIDGACRVWPISSLADFLTAFGGPIETLSAMAVALPCLPSIREMTIDLKVLAHRPFAKCGRGDDIFVVVIKLHLCSGSSSLKMSQPSEHRGRSGLGHTLWRISDESDELSFKHNMGNAVADIQDAVRKHRGHDLEIVWPEADGEPQLG